MNELQIISDANLISEDHLSALTMINDKITTGFQHRILYRPEYLMRVSVLDDIKHPTPDAKYWQANLERDVHFHELVYLSFDFREKVADIEIKKERLNETVSQARQNKIDIQIERMKTDLIFMKKNGEDRVREITTWTKIMDELEPLLEFDKDDPDAYMAKAFPLRFARQKELAERSGMNDMDGYINIAGLTHTAFNNPDTLALLTKEGNNNSIQ